jgi:hypothetical protein
VAISSGHAISGVILVDQVRSVSWEKRYVKVAGAAPVKLLDQVRERLAGTAANRTNRRTEITLADFLPKLEVVSL